MKSLVYTKPDGSIDQQAMQNAYGDRVIVPLDKCKLEEGDIIVYKLSSVMDPIYAYYEGHSTSAYSLYDPTHYKSFRRHKDIDPISKDRILGKLDLDGLKHKTDKYPKNWKDIKTGDDVVLEAYDQLLIIKDSYPNNFNYLKNLSTHLASKGKVLRVNSISVSATFPGVTGYVLVPYEAILYFDSGTEKNHNSSEFMPNIEKQGWVYNKPDNERKGIKITRIESIDIQVKRNRRVFFK